MKKNNRILAVAAIVLASTSIQAQHTESGYFTDGYLYRHEMNPAFDADQNYVSMPVLGNMDFTVHGNVGLTTFLYNVNGRTTIFTSPLVPTSEFLGNIKDRNRLGTNEKIQIIGAGFKSFGGYSNIGINLRMNEENCIPGSLFSLAKEGLSNKTYDIRDFRSHADTYVELAIGHSHKIGDRWRVGGNLKFLLGGGNIDAYFNKAELTFNGNDWTAVTNAVVESSVQGMKYKTTSVERGPEGHKTTHTYVNDFDFEGVGLNGFGMAIDLGAEFKLNEDWRFSAAFLDLGFISWSNNVVASTNGDRTFSLGQYTFNVDKDADNSFDKEIDRLTENLASLYELQDNGDQGKSTKALGATMNVGVEYTLPVYRKLSFGLLNTTRIQGALSWTDFRLSANWKPASAFSMGVNFAAGTYGNSFGWILNVHPNGFNLFLAMDHTMGKLAKQGIPLSSNLSGSIGINFPF